MKTPDIVSRSDSGEKIYRCPECEFDSDSLTDLEYVVIGTELPADYYFTWEKRYELQQLLQ